MTNLHDDFHGLLSFEDDSISQAYLEYLKAGKLPDSTGTSKKVLVIGCGIAGMVSAAMLKKAGHEVTIVEANTRVGGRCKTFRNTHEKQYFEDSHLSAEAGAMRIPDKHRLAMQLIADSGVATQHFFNRSIEKSLADKVSSGIPGEQSRLPKKSGNDLIHINGCHLTRGSKDLTGSYEYSGADVGDLLNYRLEPHENIQARKLIDAVFHNIKKRVAADPHGQWPKIIEEFGEYSLRSFLLKTCPELSEEALELMGVMENLSSRMSYCFIQNFIALGILEPDAIFWLIRGGTDKFTQAYFQQQGLEDITFLNQTVVSLYKTGDKVAIKTKVSRVIDKTSDLDEATETRLAEQCWDEVITAIPFSALRMVKVWPAFSQKKHRAIRELHYDAATKVLLEFRERFWETQHDIYGGASVTDLPNRFMHYPSEGMTSRKGGVMLVSYSLADDARKWDSMSDYDRFCYALDNVAITHAIHTPDASWHERQLAQQRIRDLCVFDPEYYKDKQDKIIGGATVSWMNNPYAFGEAAIFYPGQLKHLHKAIVQSEWVNSQGKCMVHFSGEHASLKHAWVEGAIESALHCALMVNENTLPSLSQPKVTL
jgi:monoamine oxidase